MKRLRTDFVSAIEVWNRRKTGEMEGKRSLPRLPNKELRRRFLESA